MERSQDHNTIQKKEMRETLKITGPLVYFPTCTNCSHGYYKKRMERVLDENKPREQAGFRKGNSTIDHLQTIHQLIEICNKFKRPLCIGYIDCEKAFDSIEHEAVFKALRSIGINETYITILEDTYTGPTTRVHMDSQVSEEIPILRAVRQGDPISPKLFTATVQNLFKNAQLEEKGINIDGATLSNLRFADDVALTTEDVRDMEHQLITVNEENLKIGLMIHKGKTKFMTNIDTTDNIQINGTETEKVTNYKYLGQTIAMENRRKQVSIRIKAGWSVFGKNREIFLDRHLPMSLKRKVFNQCVLPAMTYGSQTWSLTKALLKKLETSQRAMERRMLNVKLKDRIRNTTIRQRTRVTDIVQYVTSTKWK